MRKLPLNKLVTGLLLVVSVGAARAQWVAFNDHFRGTNTAPNATEYNVLTASGITNSGYLKNIDSGTNLPVTLTITNRGASSTSSSAAPVGGTPAATAFSSFIDWGRSTDGKQNSILLSTNLGGNVQAMTAHVFKNLNTSRKYSLKATSVFSNASFANRWSLVRIEGANSFKHAHSANVLTYANAFTSLATNEAAFCTGNNAVTGDVVAWEDIVPKTSTLVLYTYPYTGKISTATNASGALAYSMTAVRLEEMGPVSIVTQPVGGNVCLNGSFTLSVGVSGSSPKFQWRKVVAGNPTPISGETNQTLTLTGMTVTTNVSVVVSNSMNAVTSSVATVYVSSVAPSFSSQPQDQTNLVGTSASFGFTVGAAVSRPFVSQWYRNTVASTNGGTRIANATNATLTLTNLATTNSGYYYAVVSNCVGAVATRAAALSVVLEPVQIVTPPQDATVAQGGSVTFNVTVSGSAPYGYQWYKGGVPLATKTNATLPLTNLKVSDSGAYSVLVTNAVSATMSSNAVLIVVQAPYDIVKLYNVNPATSNTVWKYNQSGINLSNAWVAPSYNDASWPSGPGGLMVEDAAAILAYRGTTLSLGNVNGTNSLYTYYFRTTFVLTNDPNALTIYTTNIFDDGIVVYLNGTEVYRMNMPDGPITHVTVAPGTLNEGTIYITNLPSGLLVMGTNYLAVEAHQVNNTSSDIVMCLGATVVFPPSSFIQITNQPPNLLVEEMKPATFTVGNVGFPSYYQWYKWSNNVAVPIPGATRQSYIITNAVYGKDEGNYFCTISNVLSLEVSSNALLTIRADTNGPVILDADGTVDNYTVTLTFNEPLLRYDATTPLASPTNVANYTITNTTDGAALTITNATFVNQTNVVLKTSAARLSDRNYIVTVTPYGVMDVAPRKNLSVKIAAPVSTSKMLLTQTDGFEYDQPLSYSQVDYYLNGTWLRLDFNPFNYVAYPGSSWGEGYGGFCTEFIADVVPFPRGGTLSQSDSYLATYFRRKFGYGASPLGVKLTMRYVGTQGAIIYFNGKEVARNNMPDGVPTPNTAARAALNTVRWTDYLDIPQTYLSVGTNQLAAEVHTMGTADNYLAFAVEMQSRIDSLTTGRVVITTQPLSQTVMEGDPVMISFKGAGGYTFQWSTNKPGSATANLPDGTNSFYYIPRATREMDNLYFKVRMAGLDNNNYIISSNAILRVVADTNQPVLLSAYLTDTNTIMATFNEPITTATANILANYKVTNAIGSNLTLISATLTNGTNVLLRFNQFNPGEYTLVVSMLRDISVAGNYIATNSRATLGLLDYPLVTFTNTVWKYNQQGDNLGTAWYAKSYSDGGADWETGRSVLDGKTPGDGTVTLRGNIGGLPVGTVLSNIALRGTDYIYTYYFRTWFNVPLLGPGATLNLAHILDDGAAFYANGSYFYALGVNTPTAAADQATRTVGDGAIEGPYSVRITNLVVGTNLLASDVHQVGTASSDITFGAELRLSVPSVVLPPGGPTNAPPPTPIMLQIRRQGSNVAVSWTNTAAWVLQSKASVMTNTPWVNVTNQTNPYLVPITNAPKVFRLKF